MATNLCIITKFYHETIVKKKNARNQRDLHKRRKISMGYYRNETMQAFPWVALGKELCKTHLGDSREWVMCIMFCINPDLFSEWALQFSYHFGYEFHYLSNNSVWGRSCNHLAISCTNSFHMFPHVYLGRFCMGELHDVPGGKFLMLIL